MPIGNGIDNRFTDRFITEPPTNFSASSHYTEMYIQCVIVKVLEKYQTMYFSNGEDGEAHGVLSVCSPVNLL